MNLFYSDKDPEVSVRHLDDKRVVKMVLETAQILSTAANIHGTKTTYKPTHQNHPWIKYASASPKNYEYVLAYFKAICK